MQSIKKSNTKEWEHLLYMRGSCLIETKRWNEARIDLRQIRDTKKYREHSIQMLIRDTQTIRGLEEDDLGISRGL